MIAVAGDSWSADRFVADLGVKLAAALAGGGEVAALTRAVTESAAAAESVCSGRPMACAAGALSSWRQAPWRTLALKSWMTRHQALSSPP